MKTTTSNSSLSKFYCTTFGHNYEISKKVTSHVKEYTCKCCKRQLTTNSDGHLTELTPVFQEINAILERIYTNRMLRIKRETEVLSTNMYQLKNIA